MVKRGMHTDYLSAPLPGAEARGLIYVQAEVVLAWLRRRTALSQCRLQHSHEAA